MDVKILEILALSLAPSFEGRYAVLTGVGMGVSLSLSMLIASAGVIILSILLPLFFDKIDGLLRSGVFSERISNLYAKYVLSVRRRAKNVVEKYGVIGLIVFVAIPLPMTGVWTGSIAGFIFGFETKKLMLALTVGGLLSILITVATYMTTRTIVG